MPPVAMHIIHHSHTTSATNETQHQRKTHTICTQIQMRSPFSFHSLFLYFFFVESSSPCNSYGLDCYCPYDGAFHSTAIIFSCSFWHVLSRNFKEFSAWMKLCSTFTMIHTTPMDNWHSNFPFKKLFTYFLPNNQNSTYLKQFICVRNRSQSINSVFWWEDTMN